MVCIQTLLQPPGWPDAEASLPPASWELADVRCLTCSDPDFWSCCLDISISQYTVPSYFHAFFFFILISSKVFYCSFLNKPLIMNPPQLKIVCWYTCFCHNLSISCKKCGFHRVLWLELLKITLWKNQGCSPFVTIHCLWLHFKLAITLEALIPVCLQKHVQQRLIHFY